MSEQEREALLPCPFCGANAHISWGSDGEICNVRCDNWGGSCMGAGKNCYSEKEAIAAWQSRAKAQVPDIAVAEVRAAEQACQDDGEQTTRESALAERWLISVQNVIGAMLQSAPQQPADPLNGGWYCAHCQRGVDPSEVTYHEQHEACGRVITNDVPPPPADKWMRCSKRMFSEADGDELGNIWICPEGGPAWLIEVSEAQSILLSSGASGWYWMPTGLRKPPAPEGE